MPHWYVQVDDTVGGFVVTDINIPVSAMDHRPNGDPEKKARILAECCTIDDAVVIAYAMNKIEYDPDDEEGKRQIFEIIRKAEL